jgi:hypothetical protein
MSTGYSELRAHLYICMSKDYTKLMSTLSSESHPLLAAAERPYSVLQIRPRSRTGWSETGRADLKVTSIRFFLPKAHALYTERA